MNQKIAKKLIRVVKTLPVIPTKKIISVKKYGHELGKDITTDRDGKGILPNTVYNGREQVETTVDHYARLKVIYQKRGQQGVIDYTGAVVRYHSMLQKKFKDSQQIAEVKEHANLNPEII